MKRRIFTYFLISIIVAIVSCSGKSKGRVSLINQSEHLITKVRILVSGNVIELEQIMPGDNVTKSFFIQTDSHYDVYVEFNQGRKLRKNLGYVTHGFDFQHNIIVSDDDIIITSEKQAAGDSD